MTAPKRGPRGPYYKPPVRIPAPDWATPDQPGYQLVSQERAVDLTGYSVAQVSRWAHRKSPIPPLALTVLQLHAYGAVVPPAWLARGIHFTGDDMATHAGITLTLGELHSYAWLRDRYQDGLRELEAREAAARAAAAPPVPLAEVIPLEALREARQARRRPPETQNPA